MKTKTKVAFRNKQKCSFNWHFGNLLSADQHSESNHHWRKWDSSGRLSIHRATLPLNQINFSTSDIGIQVECNWYLIISWERRGRGNFLVYFVSIKCFYLITLPDKFQLQCTLFVHVSVLNMASILNLNMCHSGEKYWGIFCSGVPWTQHSGINMS